MNLLAIFLSALIIVWKNLIPQSVNIQVWNAAVNNFFLNSSKEKKMSTDDTAYIIIGVFFAVLFVIIMIFGIRHVYKNQTKEKEKKSREDDTFQSDVDINASIYQ